MLWMLVRLIVILYKLVHEYNFFLNDIMFNNISYVADNHVTFQTLFFEKNGDVIYELL